MEDIILEMYGLVIVILCTSEIVKYFGEFFPFMYVFNGRKCIVLYGTDLFISHLYLIHLVLL